VSRDQWQGRIGSVADLHEAERPQAFSQPEILVEVMDFHSKSFKKPKVLDSSG